MAVFESMIQLMIDSGAYYVFIWLLFAGFIYGLLEKNDVFGDSSATGGVSLGGSLFILIGIYSFAPSGLFLNFSAAIGFALFAIFGTVIMLSMGGINITELGDNMSDNPIAGLGFLLVIISFLGALAYNLDWGGLLGNVGSAWQDVVFPVLFLIFMLLIIKETTD
jgi:hypothetical protein